MTEVALPYHEGSLQDPLHCNTVESRIITGQYDNDMYKGEDMNYMVLLQIFK